MQEQLGVGFRVGRRAGLLEFTTTLRSTSNVANSAAYLVHPISLSRWSIRCCSVHDRLIPSLDAQLPIFRRGRGCRQAGWSTTLATRGTESSRAVSRKRIDLTENVTIPLHWLAPLLRLQACWRLLLNYTQLDAFSPAILTPPRQFTSLAPRQRINTRC